VCGPCQVALVVLDRIATDAVVVTIASNLKDSDVANRRTAASQLRVFGPVARAAAPNLIEALRDNSVRMDAHEALKAMGNEAVPELVRALKTNTGSARTSIIFLLGDAGPAAKASVPQLEKLLKANSDRERRDAAMAIARIDSTNRAVIQFFRPWLKSASRTERLIAVDSLSRMKSQGEQAIPVLMGLLKEEDLEPGNLDRMIVALWRYGPRARGYSQAVTALLKERASSGEEHGVSALLAGALLRIDGWSREARSIATRELSVIASLVVTKDEDLQEFAADTLGRLGPDGRRALPQLRTALNHRNERVRKAATEAIKKIEMPDRRE
jgi:HEAT repeat protein